jgi:hypothetical protein
VEILQTSALRYMGISVVETAKNYWHADGDNHVTSGQKHVSEYAYYRFVRYMLTFLNWCLYWYVAFELRTSVIYFSNVSILDGG